MRKILMVLTLLLGVWAGPAAAHKVIAAAWSAGDIVEGEIGFSSGEPAPQGTVVRVLGPDGAQLGRTEVDADGLFRFKPIEPVPHRFVADFGQGHIGEVELALDELPVQLTRGAAPAAEAAARTAGAAVDVVPINATELERIVAVAVQRELAPLKRELARSDEAASLQSIIAGLGYIAGIFGLLFFVYARRRS